MNDFPDHDPDHNDLMPVSPDEIARASDILGRDFPEELMQIWAKSGAGSMHTSTDGLISTSFPRILLAPGQVAAAVTNDGEYRNYGWPHSGLPFFDMGDRLFAVIYERPDGTTAIRWNDETDDTPIAGSVGEFLDMIRADPDLSDPWD